MNSMLDALRQIEAMSPEAMSPEVPSDDRSDSRRQPEPVGPLEPEASIERGESPLRWADAFPRVECVTAEAPAADSVVVETTPIAALAQPVVPCVPPAQLPERPTESARSQTRCVRDDPPRHDPRYGRLAEALIAGLPAEGRASLLLVGTEPGGSRPAVIVSLAGELARQTKDEVLLVDCDFHRADLARVAGAELRKPRGLADVLVGESPWRDVVARTRTEGVGVLPGTRLPEGPAWRRLVAADLTSLVREMNEGYRFVLCTGTWSSDPLTIPLAACCGGTYLIVRLGETDGRAAGRAIREIKRHGGRTLGTIVSKAD